MNYMKPCRFSEFLVQLSKKKRLFMGFVQKYYCPELLPLGILVQGFFKGLCSNNSFWRNIHLWLDDTSQSYINFLNNVISDDFDETLDCDLIFYKCQSD